jgi:TetR/AcrR family transcriptional repressor of bet genes
MARRDTRDTRREQLIAATIESIAKRGFARTTLADVAREADLPQEIVDSYFKSKKALLVATLRHMVEQYDAHSAAAVRQAGSCPAAQLDALITADFDPAACSRKMVTVWYAFWGETRWRGNFLRLCARWNQAYMKRTRDRIQAIIDAGGYRQLDAGEIARGLNAMIDGLWQEILLDPDGIEREQARRVCRAYVGQFFPREFGRPPPAATAA